ncbi:hypothetical protein SFA35_07445 [Pseudomonas sp. HR96]|uniref:hypothetical protein n=1 Tax=Pseudomonas sp. HR96 TaxID=1027966 RepID=UPI002A7590FE|nr:hypothetical protein [Pseudomonas sp. HR96]WPP01185.1 hypothetical protein SFA35_07445 [Pseudomonas sp. HR96]
MVSILTPGRQQAGQADMAFDPSTALEALAGFELHGITRSEDDATLYLALSKGNHFALAALADDGRSVPTFGDQGRLIDSFDNSSGDGVKPGRRVARLGDRVLIGGMIEHAPGQYSPALACYTAEGHRDSRFNGTGQLSLAQALAENHCAMGPISFQTNLALCSSSSAASATQQDFTQVNFDMVVANEEIYVIATGRVGDQARLSGLVFCLTSSGQLDQRFGDRGVVALSSPSYSVLLRSVAVGKEGIYVAGGASGGHNPALVARVTFCGHHDTAFGDEGLGGYGITAQSFRINDVVLDASGCLYGVGVGSRTRAIAVRFDAAGRQVTAFAGQGAYIPGLPYSALTYAQVDGEGRLVFIGEYLDEANGYLQAACGRLHSDGTADLDFGPQGLVKLDAFDSIGSNLIVQANRQLLAVGYTRRKTPFAVRLHG